MSDIKDVSVFYSIEHGSWTPIIAGVNTHHDDDENKKNFEKTYMFDNNKTYYMVFDEYDNNRNLIDTDLIIGFVIVKDPVGGSYQTNSLVTNSCINALISPVSIIFPCRIVHVIVTILPI